MLLPNDTSEVFKEGEIDQLLPYTPRWPLFFHMVCATFQMGASAYFHNFYCVNKEACALLKWDLAGICLMIMGSCTPPFFYGFMCEDSWSWGKFYLAQVWTCSLLALLVTLFIQYIPISWNAKRRI